MSTKRPTKRRDPVSAAPLSVSQLTALPLLGIDARRYLQLLAAHEVPHAKLGKLRVAMLDDVRTILRELAAVPEGAQRDGNEEAPQPETGDAVLAAMGLRRAS